MHANQKSQAAPRPKAWLVMHLFILGALLLTNAVPAQATTRYEVGIAVGATILRMDEPALNERLANIRQLGTDWIRVDFSWRIIQPVDRNHYNWEKYDRVVKAAKKHDLKILAVINYTPAWARESQCAALVTPEELAQKCIPEDMHEFARFARALAIRYKNENIRGWEIWNEPNLTGHWKSAKTHNKVRVDPAKYARMANLAAKQIRRHHPDSVIIAGGLAPLFEPQAHVGMRQSDYLKDLLPLLKPRLFDGIAIHPYSWPNMPSKKATYNAFYTVDNGKQQMNLRAIMTRAGWGDKQIWGTEYGASTKGQRPIGLPLAEGRPDHVTEGMQARIVEQGIGQWYKKAHVGPLFVHSDSDQWLPKRKNEAGFGLRRHDGTKKPAYQALQRATQTINKSFR